MVKEVKNCKQYPRVHEELEPSKFKIKDDIRDDLARFTIYGGASVLCIAALLSLYNGSYVPLSATAAVVVPLMALVIRHYFR